MTGEFKTSVGLVKIRVKNGHPARTKVLSSRIVKTRVILILDLKQIKNILNNIKFIPFISDFCRKQPPAFIRIITILTPLRNNVRGMKFGRTLYLSAITESVPDSKYLEFALKF